MHRYFSSSAQYKDKGEGGYFKTLLVKKKKKATYVIYTLQVWHMLLMPKGFQGIDAEKEKTKNLPI